MEPLFPHFESLRPEHRPLIEKITGRFPPYSDFNFTSLWSWDTRKQTRFSILNGNLVVRFSDYVTQEPFFSFLGDQMVNETAQALLDLAQQEGIHPQLKLLPKKTAERLDPERFHVVNDADNHDYILSVDLLRSYAGARFEKHRNKVNRFTRLHQTETNMLDLSDRLTQGPCEKLFLAWKDWKQLSPSETENELKAIRHFFRLVSMDHTFVAIGIFLRGELLGFSINELLENGYGMQHFEKAMPAQFTGIYQYLNQETARVLWENGCQFLNCQQDLGLAGLRANKMGMSPVAFFEKFRVTRNTM